jgi:DUF4097 and DUF4098 domain-containing protein YvlB
MESTVKTKWISLIIVIGVIFAMITLIAGLLPSFNSIDEEKSISLNNVDEIRVILSSETVHIHRSESGGEVRFHYHGNCWPKFNLVIENANGKVSVRRESLIRLGDMTLDIYLPADYSKTLDVKVTSGAVTTESFNLENFRMNASSGKFTADTIKAAVVSIQSTAGAIDVKSINAEQLAITTQSGNITTGQCAVREAVVEATSGNIVLAGVTGNINLKTSSGKVTLSYPTFDNYKLKVGTTSGSVALELPASAGFLLDAQSNSGKIQSDFSVDNAEGANKKGATAQVGIGTGQITVNTTSGNIHLRKEK